MSALQHTSGLSCQCVSMSVYQRVTCSTYQINISSCQDINTPFCKFQNILLLQFQPAKRLPCHLVNEGEVSTSPFHVTVTLRIKIKHNFSGNSGLSTWWGHWKTLHLTCKFLHSYNKSPQWRRPLPKKLWDLLHSERSPCRVEDQSPKNYKTVPQIQNLSSWGNLQWRGCKT